MRGPVPVDFRALNREIVIELPDEPPDPTIAAAAASLAEGLFETEKRDAREAGLTKLPGFRIWANGHLYERPEIDL